MTYALREARSLATHALAAPIAREHARMALAALGLSGDRSTNRSTPAPLRPRILLPCVNGPDDIEPRARKWTGTSGPTVDLYAATIPSPVSRRPDLPMRATTLWAYHGRR